MLINSPFFQAFARACAPANPGDHARKFNIAFLAYSTQLDDRVLLWPIAISETVILAAITC
jgi:hypothetical protein